MSIPVESKPTPRESIPSINLNHGIFKFFTSSWVIKADTSNSTCRKYFKDTIRKEVRPLGHVSILTIS